MFLTIVLCFLPLIAANPLSAPDEEIFTQRVNSEYRLPEDTIEVSSYKIDLSLNETVFELAKFQGEAWIIFKSLKDSETLQIHANRLAISEIEMANQGGYRINITNENLESDSSTDILTLNVSPSLEANVLYQIRFVYEGDLRTNEMYGFYRSEYENSAGEKRYLGTTQFQPTHARKVFPCFDEPSYKAIFDISIVHPREYQAVGNTRGSRSNIGEAFTRTTFVTTPKMPTYLIAFVVSDFTCSENSIEENVPHYICSRPESSDTRDLALEYGPKLTWSLENFTGIKHINSTINKIHQFAIPDFAAGAMENWGLITYRERYLLWDPAESSNRYKQNVITIEAHELAHFWFGNLVTCHWWSDTFLNEGFATYFEYHAPYDVESDLETNKQFVIEQLQPVLVSDSSPNSAPLSSPASTQSQISGRFSSISYNKGGSIFRMVEHFMGLENFKKGINNYLSTHQFSNTKPEDLWTALQAFAPNTLPPGRTINDLMKNWVEKAGYPVLNVTLDGDKFTITQKRFLTSGEPKDDEVWYIPLTYTTRSNPYNFQDTSVTQWIDPVVPFSGTLSNASDWIVLNNQQTSFYRVDYQDELFERIKTALNQPGFSGIHELNRAQIVDDYFNFARNGYKNFGQLIDLLRFLQKETSYYVWYPSFTAFNYITQRTTNPVLVNALSNFILDSVENFYNSLPFNEAKDDNQIYTLSKVLVIPWTCRLGLQNCVENALKAFEVYRTTRQHPDKNLRTVIYCNGLRHSTNINSDWDFMWNEYLNTKLSTEQATLISALGCAKDETVLKRFLGYSITENSGIRRQDALSVFSAVYSGNPEGVDVALDFLIENYDAILNYYGSMNSLSSLFSGIAGRLTRQDQIDKLQAFIDNTDLGNFQTTAQSAVNSATNNLKTTERLERELNSFFVPPVVDSSDRLVVGISTFIITIFAICYQLWV